MTTSTSTPTSELREKVYEFILRSGAAGLTDEEISKGLRVSGDIARPRRNELVHSSLVVNSGTRRVTKRGRTAIVWKAVRKPAAAKTVTVKPVAKTVKTAPKIATRAVVKATPARTAKPAVKTAKAATKPIVRKATKAAVRRARR